MKFLKTFKVYENENTQLNPLLVEYIDVIRKNSLETAIIGKSSIFFMTKDRNIYSIEFFDSNVKYISLILRSSPFNFGIPSDPKNIMSIMHTGSSVHLSPEELNNYFEKEFKTSIEKWKELVAKDSSLYQYVPVEILNIIRPKLSSISSLGIFENSETVNMYLTNYYTVAKKHALNIIIVNSYTFHFLHKDGTIYKVTQDQTTNEIELWVSMNSVFNVKGNNDTFKYELTLMSPQRFDDWLEETFQNTIRHWKDLVAKDSSMYQHAPIEILDIIRPKLSPMSRIGIFENINSKMKEIEPILNTYAITWKYYHETMIKFELVNEINYMLRLIPNGKYQLSNDIDDYNSSLNYDTVEELKDLMHDITIKTVLDWRFEIEDDPAAAVNCPPKVLKILKHKLSPAADLGIFDN